MHKYLVFDLDGTLAPIGEATPGICVEKLKKLEQRNYRIVICSGKSADYLSGFMRQMQLKDPILISENGSTITYGKKLPPEKYIELNCTEEERSNLKAVTQLIRSNFPDTLWMQPNRFAICVFGSTDQILDELQNMLDEHSASPEKLVIIRHKDCFDILPESINKSSGLKRLCEEEHAQPSDFITIGDSPNDLPMFKFAHMSISIGPAMKGSTDRNFDDLEGALDFLLEAQI